MQNYQEKRKLRKVIHSNATIILLFIVFIVLGISTARIFLKSRLAFINSSKIEKELSALTDKRDKLRKELEKLQSEAGMEEEIRKKFNVAKSGEEVLLIMDKDGGNGTDTKKESIGIWEWFKSVF